MFAPRGWLSRRFLRQTYRTIASSELFDSAYYRKRNLRGISKLQDPLWHFVTKGWRAGLSPSPHFDTKYYVTKNDDVRVAKLNPLFHFAEYGQAERRLPVRSSLEAQHVATPEASPLRYFITPSLGQKRVSVLLDSATDLTDHAATLTVLRLASQKAEIESASLRILHRTSALNHISLNEALGGLPRTLQDSLEITEVPTSLTYSDLPFFQDEISIATSWSSSFALRYVTDPANSFTVGGLGETISLIANNQHERDLIAQQHISIPETLPEEVFKRLEAHGPSTLPGLVACVDIETHPLAYSLLVGALGEFLLTRSPDLALFPVTLVGNPGPRFAFGEELHPTLMTPREFVQADVSASCVVVLSEIGDEKPEALATTGFHVIHGTPQDSEKDMKGSAEKRTVMKTVLTAEALKKALSEVFS
ncbi:MAG: hypothetical protein RIE23_05635 [Pontimonas sp.]